MQLDTDKITINGEPIKISDKEVKCVAIAGLCHDLGHGPFSHIWEFFLKKRNIEWAHEDESVKIFEEICKKNQLLDLEEQELVCDLIKETRAMLQKIVNNEDTKIDVDKWDYFERDCHFLGKRNSFDHDRLMQFIRVVKGEKNNKLVLAYRDKEAKSIDLMFYMRWIYHHKYYKHLKINIINDMLIDAFIAAGLNETHTRNDDYEILQLLKEPGTTQANILNRILKRDLYEAVVL
uniref:HD domain-containing protein n=1 Tax=Strigamia maritima TaxID=126957 RepID=T1JBU5_STRMM